MLPDGEKLFRENLGCLAAADPGLAARIAQVRPAPHLEFVEARSGALVPCAKRAGGSVALHSLFDPQREARRLYAATRGSGYLACLGLGAGFVPALFVEDPEPTGLLIIEKDPQVLHALFRALSFCPVLSDPRVRLVAGTGDIRASLASSFLPAISRDLRTVLLKPWCDEEREFFSRAADEVRAAVADIRSDFSVQAHFGKRWFANTLLNIASAPETFPVLPQCSEAHITAAGPSLEQGIPLLARRSPASFLLATDTSLPALVQQGVRPDAVVSLDCQIHSYRHFLAAMPRDILYFFDLASPAFLPRRAGARCLFYASAHPFSQFASIHWMRLPRVDSTGGSVTHAAFSLARALGARTIHVYGADFSYPAGKAYARGTYQYDYFRGGESRLLPLESSFFSFIRRSALVREVQNGVPCYTTSLLLHYKARFEKLQANPGPELFHGGKQPSTAEMHMREFLPGYRQLLQNLPAPSPPMGRYIMSLTADQRGLLSTILPIAASVIRETPDAAAGAAALETARQWALGRLWRLTAGSAQIRQD
ncbi:MAG TPA: 6-hydroxymethylpterin diphosphokinase MptE-like protein [Spirochaetia bacterium]|nr:6-hydroxymethylpterin diphosphokinase MptE-like protein [Spirochaetia bacterium]